LAGRTGHSHIFKISARVGDPGGNEAADKAAKAAAKATANAPTLGPGENSNNGAVGH